MFFASREMQQRRQPSAAAKLTTASGCPARQEAPPAPSAAAAWWLQRSLGNSPQAFLAELTSQGVHVSEPGEARERAAEQTAAQILPRTGEAQRPAAGERAPAVTDEDGAPEEEGVLDEDRPPRAGGPSPMPTALQPLPAAHSQLERRLAAQYGPGEALPSDLRRRVEPHLGYDLSAVRLHTQGVDAAADHFAARAFTAGQHIYFRADEYHPESAPGMKMLLHELVHTTQAGDAADSIQRTPSISSWEFKNSGRTDADNCCPICPKNLGVDSRNRGAGSFTNGMQLQAFITDDEAGAAYDIKRVKERSTWQRVGGAWQNLSHVGPGADDDSSNNDECLTPVIRVPYLPYIYSEDQPGFAGTTGFGASATDAVYKASFTESVQVTPSGGSPVTVATSFDWHSITWITQSGGSWTIDTARSEIAPGAVTVGTAAP